MVLLWSVAFVSTKEGCRGRHVEAATMTLVAAVAAAAIVVLAGKGGGTGGGSASIVTWTFAIVRVSPWNHPVSAVDDR